MALAHLRADLAAVTSEISMLFLVVLASCQPRSAPEENVAVAKSAKSADRVSGSTVHALFDLSSVSGAPFPSDLYTVADTSNRTGLRVNMPLPDGCNPGCTCSTRRSDCEDLEVINKLDGFNIMPRIAIPFDGLIDPASVSSSSVFLVELAQQGDETTIAHTSGINQPVWDPATLTLYVESDEVLRQTARYGVVVTTGILDASGHPVAASDDFESFRHDLNYGQRDSEDGKAYRKAMIGTLAGLEQWGVAKKDVVALSLFTTQSTTATLENIRDFIKGSASPAPANFMIGSNGTRAAFLVSSISGIVNKQHTKVKPDGFTNATVPLAALNFVPDAVGTVAWGTFASPQFIGSNAVFAPAGTLEVPAPFGDANLAFVVFLPAGDPPANGWPVVFLGHGGTTSIHSDAVWSFVSKLASKGFASIALNAVGRGAGPLSFVEVTLKSGMVVQAPTPGRCVDKDNVPNGTIANTEGAVAQAPNIIVGQRDAVRQTAIDYMQLVRVIEAGMDVDGDGTADLDPAQMAFLGNSFAVGYELLFMAIEPDVPVAAVGSPGGLPGRADLLSMRPAGRTTVGLELQAHLPSLLNSADGLTTYPRGVSGLPTAPPYYNENIPLRDLPTVTNDVPGALAIQEYFEHVEWVQNSEDAAAYAPHLHHEPLPGVPAKSILILFAKGDQTAPNPRTSYIVRSGLFHDNTIFYRNDLAFAQEPTLVPKDPHTFLQRWSSPGITGQVAQGGQQTVATFLASGGTAFDAPHPAQFFEFPIQTLPEDFSYLPP